VKRNRHQPSTGHVLDRALSLIAPTKEQADSCRVEAQDALVEIEFHKRQALANDYDRTKTGKAAARRLAKALARVEQVLSSKTHAPSLEIWLASKGIRESAKRLREHCLSIAGSPSGKVPNKEAEAKRNAAKAAVDLIFIYNKLKLHPINSASPLCKLAALLFGDEQANLQSHCKAALRKKRGQK
jgi:hypothetical protein